VEVVRRSSKAGFDRTRTVTENLLPKQSNSVFDKQPITLYPLTMLIRTVSSAHAWVCG